MNRTRLLGPLAGLLLIGSVLGACADPDRDDSGPGQGGATTVPGNPPTTKPIQPTGQVTVTGMVTEGVEPGCLLLDATDGTRYLLVGGERAELQSGSRVAVTGRVAADLLSTCQQGRPLVVATIEPAP